jgi:hypothetical protein
MIFHLCLTSALIIIHALAAADLDPAFEDERVKMENLMRYVSHLMIVMCRYFISVKSSRDPITATVDCSTWYRMGEEIDCQFSVTS